MQRPPSDPSLMSARGDDSAVDVEVAVARPPRVVSPASVGDRSVGDRFKAMGEPEPHRRGWLRQSAGALVSIVFHIVLVTVLGIWAYGARGDGFAGEEVAIGELPFVELEDNDTTELETQQDSGDITAEMELSEVAPLSISEAGQLELIDVASGMGVGGQGAATVDAGMKTGMAGQASFMGLHASGRRFCIIADCSGSMKGGKMEHLRREVVRTISSLSGSTRFQIFFFNGKAIPFPFPGWRRPGADLTELRRWVENDIRPTGSTHPDEAFRSAFELSPLPDVIFFMTDGKFSERVVDVIASLNAANRRVPIHTITFVSRSAEKTMRRIAADSGGKYRHVAGF